MAIFASKFANLCYSIYSFVCCKNYRFIIVLYSLIKKKYDNLGGSWQGWLEAVSGWYEEAMSDEIVINSSA